MRRLLWILALGMLCGCQSTEEAAPRPATADTRPTRNEPPPEALQAQQQAQEQMRSRAAAQGTAMQRGTTEQKTGP
jgi:hypothetical protein